MQKDISQPRGFRQVLGFRQVVSIAIAAISPTTSVFLVYGDDLKAAGTGVFWAFVLGAIIAISMAFCYAELGSVHPRTGGAYSIVEKVLGREFGFIASVLFLILGLFSTASILVAAATYLNSLVPALPVNWIAVGFMLLITLFSLERIGTASWVATLMLLIEVVVIIAFIILAFCHVHYSLGFLLRPTTVDGHGSHISVSTAVLFSAVVPALFAFNGYDWPLYFAEETAEPKRVLPKAVMVSVFSAVVLELLAVVAATLAMPSVSTAIGVDSPLAFIAEAVMGHIGSTILLIGVVIAMFDTGLSANLGYARIYLDSAREKNWPEPLNRLFVSMNRNNVPKWGFAFLFVGNAILCYFTSLSNLISFTGVMIVVVYLLIAVSALVSRLRERNRERPFRMPWWPLPPIIAIIGVILALSQQTMRDLLITAAIIVVSGLYWILLRRFRSAPRA